MPIIATMFCIFFGLLTKMVTISKGGGQFFLVYLIDCIGSSVDEDRRSKWRYHRA